MPKPVLAAMLAMLCACSAEAADSADATPPDQVEIEYLAHACFRLHADDGTVLMIDPFASRIWLGYDFPGEMLSTANVLISHPHYDHDYGEFIGNPLPWQPEQTILRDVGKSDIGPFHITGIEGKHADPWGTEFGQKNTIWLIEVAGMRIAHLGDNGPLSDSAAQALVSVDLLMAPIDGNEHILKYAELDAIVATLQPRVVVPMHYRLPDLESNAMSPEDLGELAPWLEGQARVQQVGGNRYTLSTATLPAMETTLVFEHGL